MASVTFPANLGGSGQTISDDADPNTGLANGGHRLRFVPALQGTIDMAEYVYQYAAKIDNAAEDAQRAENARAYVEAYAGALKSNIETYYDKLATLKLDFGRGRYFADDGDLTETTSPADLLTVARATPKWVEGPNGKLREVPPHVIARQWRNGVPQGALLEKSSTNLLLHSTDMTNAGVVRQDCSITVSSEVSPIIGQSAFTFEATADTASGAHSGGFSVVAGQKYTATIIAKAGTANEIALVFKGFTSGWQAGSVRFDGTKDPTVGFAWNLEEQYIIADGWTFARVSCVADQDSDAASVQYRVMNDDAFAAIGSTIHVAHWQVEEGEGSSIIPTTDSPVTRAADNVSRTMGEEFNPREGTFFFSFVPTAEPSQNFTGYATNSTNANARSFQVNGSRGTGKIQASARVGSTLFASAEVDLVVGMEYKAAITINPLQPAAAVNGVVSTGAGDNTGLVPNVLLRAMTGGFAADGVLFLGATYIPRALTETELQELTS